MKDLCVYLTEDNLVFVCRSECNLTARAAAGGGGGDLDLFNFILIKTIIQCLKSPNIEIDKTL